MLIVQKIHKTTTEKLQNGSFDLVLVSIRNAYSALNAIITKKLYRKPAQKQNCNKT